MFLIAGENGVRLRHVGRTFSRLPVGRCPLPVHPSNQAVQHPEDTEDGQTPTHICYRISVLILSPWKPRTTHLLLYKLGLHHPSFGDDRDKEMIATFLLYIYYRPIYLYIYLGIHYKT